MHFYVAVGLPLKASRVTPFPVRGNTQGCHVLRICHIPFKKLKTTYLSRSYSTLVSLMPQIFLLKSLFGIPCSAFHPSHWDFLGLIPVLSHSFAWKQSQSLHKSFSCKIVKDENTKIFSSQSRRKAVILKKNPNKNNHPNLPHPPSLSSDCPGCWIFADLKF